VPNVSENFGSGPPSVAAMHFLRGATSDAPGDDAGRGSESAGAREGRAGASGLAGRIDDGVLVLVMFVMTMPVLVLHWFVEVFVLGSPSTAAGSTAVLSAFAFGTAARPLAHKLELRNP
jgi:hypothetical protein